MLYTSIHHYSYKTSLIILLHHGQVFVCFFASPPITGIKIAAIDREDGHTEPVYVAKYWDDLGLS